MSDAAGEGSGGMMNGGGPSERTSVFRDDLAAVEETSY